MSIFNRVRNVFQNVFSYLYGIIIGRSEKCILFGSWMGEKIADNSRYLFQYANSQKEILGLDHVVWATRDKNVQTLLKGMGYECVMIGTRESIYWHCKCGIHFICDAQFDSKELLGDIDSSYSAGAIKIQLWHGNGIKCVPAVGSQKRGIIRVLRNFSTQGLWYIGNYYFLCKSDIDSVFFNKKFGATENICIDSAYPRTCQCIQLFPNEEKIIDYIKKYERCIIYLPTFRKDYGNYVHPLSNRSLVEYIENTNTLWIEKPHTADRNSSTIIKNVNSKNVLSLDSTFDINVLYNYVDLLITDYSSAMLDALFYRIPVVYYTPDYDYYINDDRGFLMDYDSVCITPKVNNYDELLLMIKKVINGFTYSEKAEKIRKQFWKYDEWSYFQIWSSILKKINEQGKV